MARPPQARVASPYRLRRAMQQKHLSHAQLAELVGCNRSRISQLKREGEPVSLDLATRISTVLEVDLDLLFDRYID